MNRFRTSALSNKLYFFAILIGLGSTLQIDAQILDVARLDYTIIPRGDSDVRYNKFRTSFNVPIKLKEDMYLTLGLDYSNINLQIEESVKENATQSDEVEDFQIIDLPIGFTYKMNEDWRFATRLIPGYSSNLTAKELKFDDMVISADVIFIKDKRGDMNLSKPYRLMLGVSYSGNRGFPFPLPFISYYRKFHEKWSYNLGIPTTNLQYHLRENHRFKLYASLDGFTSNMQRGIVLSDGTIADSINMSIILGGLQYEFHFLDLFELYVRAAYMFDKKVKFRDDNKDDLITIDDASGAYFRTGVRLKIF